jgi:hypothetical protein
MEKKKIHLQEVNVITTDFDNGEVLKETKTQVSMFESEPPYVKLYISDIVKLNGLPSYANDVLLHLVKNMGYNNIVPMYKPIKLMICNELGMKLNTMNKAIQELYEKNILIRAHRGLYMLDPLIFGRGSWKEIKDIRMTIDYNSDGKRVITSSINTEIKQIS